MAEQYMHLVGAEKVSSAAREISCALERLSAVVADFGYHVTRLQLALETEQQSRDEWMARFEAAVGHMRHGTGRVPAPEHHPKEW